MRISIPVSVAPVGDGYRVRFFGAAFRGTHCYGATPEEALESARDHVARVLELYHAPGAEPLPLGGRVPKVGRSLPGRAADLTQIVVDVTDRLPKRDEASDEIPETGETGAKPAYRDRIRLVRDRYPRAYERWNGAEDERLRHLRDRDRTVKQISEEFQRQPGAVRSRLDKLGLMNRRPSTRGTGNCNE